MTKISSPFLLLILKRLMNFIILLDWRDPTTDLGRASSY
jgi:hypothetical protein